MAEQLAHDLEAASAIGLAQVRLGQAMLSQDVDVDVCVVGAGLAGLTVAREVARKGWTVAVLEAKRVAWNAS